MSEPQLKKQRLQCEYIIPTKNRRCGMTRSANEKDQNIIYCLEHRYLLDLGSGSGDKENRVRVPCPLDNKHTVWEFELAKHLKKCNKKKIKHSNDDKEYFLKDYNLGNECISFDEEGGITNDLSTKECIMETIDLVTKYFEENSIDIPEYFKHNDIMEDKRYPQLDDNDNIGRKYHAIQQSSLIQNMIDHNILTKNVPNNFMEFGCGRAELSRYINHVNQVTTETNQKVSHFILIDRSTNRMKFDTKIVSDLEEINEKRNHKNIAEITRIRIDIKDLNLEPLLRKNEKYIAISKHLCGVATDLTLKCLIGHQDKDIENRLQGVCIAMCCRHVCKHDSYVNPKFIKSILQDYDSNKKLDYKQFFMALTKIVSWATSGGPPNKNNESTQQETTHFSNLNPEDRLKIGLKARSLLDQGRVLWLKSRLDKSKFEIKLIKYCESNVTLENNALLVYKK